MFCRELDLSRIRLQLIITPIISFCVKFSNISKVGCNASPSISLPADQMPYSSTNISIILILFLIIYYCTINYTRKCLTMKQFFPNYYHLVLTIIVFTIYYIIICTSSYHQLQNFYQLEYV